MCKIDIWTDGACSGNPGRGGWAALLTTKLPDGRDFWKSFSGGFKLTTNNRMELMAVLQGLRAVRGSGHEITIHSDSQTFVKPFTSGNAAKRVLSGTQVNGDLWAEILALAQHHSVTAEWVKGHADSEYNVKCDALAVEARDSKSSAIDTGYTHAQP